MLHPEPTHTKTCRLLVRERSGSINQKTLLATDYLNHFNEVVMILDMLASMPECFEEAEAWQPKSYVRHFEDSGFPEKALAILAYEQAPLDRRVPFDALVDEINELVQDGLVTVGAALAADDADRMYVVLQSLTQSLRDMIGRAGAIINGDDNAVEAAVGTGTESAGGGNVEADLGAPGDGGADDDADGEAADGTTMDQASIDSLFD